jgi:glycosyltransferase involved in cell wall biosynthesis
MSRVRGVAGWRPASTTGGAVAQLARLGRMDIVHAHMTAAEAAAFITKPRHRARLAATAHFASAPRWRRLAGQMDERIAISEFVASAVPSTRILSNGVENIDPGPARRECSVLVMQRLEAEKHTEVALQAWSESKLRHSGWKLVIAGRGTEAATLGRLSIELGIAASVEWAGFVVDPHDLLSRAGIFLAPAPAEPFGFAVVEAMARATPVVAADGGAHRETVGVDGWLFPVGDAHACARLLDDVETRDRALYGDSLRTRQRELFDIETHVDRLLRVYQELIG